MRYTLAMDNTEYIVWYTDLNRLNLEDPWIRKWWIQQVLIHGRIEDIKQLDFNDVRRFLSTLNLDYKIKSLWEDYFRHQDANTHRPARRDT
jgi:hypothetical protein